MLPDVDAAELEAEVAAAVRSWDDDLAERGGRASSARSGRRTLLAMCDGEAIPQTYKTDVPASAAVDDLDKILQLRESGESVAFDLWESEGYVGGVPIEDSPARRAAGPPATITRVWRLSIYRTGSPITLTDVLPRLQHMGVDVVDEHPYEFAAAEPFWIYDFGLPQKLRGRRRGGLARTPASVASVKELVQDALTALWHGDVEDDGFNALVLDGHLTWRQVVVLRAYAKYLRQAGSTFSQNYIERVLRSNITVTRLLVRLFESRFDPDRADGRGRAQRGHHRGDQGRARRGGQPRPGPHPARLLGPDPGHAADELLRRALGAAAAGPVPGGQARRRAGARPARAAAAVRAVRLLAAGSRPCTCGSPAWPGAGCAGRTGGRTSAPRSSAWPRRRR